VEGKVTAALRLRPDRGAETVVYIAHGNYKPDPAQNPKRASSQAARRREFYHGQKEFRSTPGTDQKNCALLAGFKRAFRFSHMNGTNSRGRTTKTEANPQTSKTTN